MSVKQPIGLRSNGLSRVTNTGNPDRLHYKVSLLSSNRQKPPVKPQKSGVYNHEQTLFVDLSQKKDDKDEGLVLMPYQCDHGSQGNGS